MLHLGKILASVAGAGGNLSPNRIYVLREHLISKYELLRRPVAMQRCLMVLIEKDRLHWDYYLSLENDLLNCRRYVEFHDANMKTYSIEFLQIFLLACNEIDILSQRICQIINPKSKPRKMANYKAIIEPILHLSTFQLNSVYSLSPFKPFQEWENDDHPKWWGDHNALKHDRFNCYENAHLQNTIYSLAGLYVLNIYYYYNYLREAQLEPQSSLFRPTVRVQRATGQMTYGYKLPHGDKLYPEQQ